MISRISRHKDLEGSGGRQNSTVAFIQGQMSQIIHVVEVEFCSAQSCTWSPDSRTHLVIRNREIDLENDDEKSRAIALSYTWGEFERTERLIGHNTMGEGISLTLGAEWAADEFTSRLVTLSFERGACWIDQLCIPQRDAEIRKALASIPTIYRTLDVVVLMPGTPCKCLGEKLESLKIAKEFGTIDD